MARLPRLVVPGLVHLVIQRGHNGGAVFLCDEDRVAYLAALRSAAADAQVGVHGFGLASSHVRLLATPVTEQGLADLMQAVGRRYVRGFNARHARRSSPWEGRFRSTVIEPGPDVLDALMVVETLVGTERAEAGSGEPPAWSSAAHHLGLRRDPLITELSDYWRLGNTPFEREASYRSRLDAGLPASQVTRILRAAESGWALASEQFAGELAMRTGRRAHPLPRGRPASDKVLDMSPIKVA